MRKGREISKSVALNNSIQYHVADRRNRAYLCPCAPVIKVGDTLIHPLRRQRKALRRVRLYYPKRWGESFVHNLFRFQGGKWA